MALLYGRAGRFASQSGGLFPARAEEEDDAAPTPPAAVEPLRRWPLHGPSPPLDFGSSWVSGGQRFYSPLLIPAPGPGPGSGSIDLLWDFSMAVPQTPRSVRGSGYGAQLAAVARRDPDRPPAPRLRGDPGEARAIASLRTRSLPANTGVLHMNDSGVRRDGTLALAPWPSTAFQPWFLGFGVVSVSSIQR